MSEEQQLLENFAANFPGDFARILARGETSEIATLLNSLPPRVSASVASKLPATLLVSLITKRHVAAETWLGSTSIENAITLLGRLPRDHALAAVNALTNQRQRRRLLQFLNYPAHTVGAFVTELPFRFSVHQSMQDVVEELRRADSTLEQPVAILDDDGRYLGLLDMWRFAIAVDQGASTSEYILKVRPIRPETPIGRAVTNTAWQSHRWLPVVDHQGHLLGAVTRHQLAEAAAREAASEQPSNLSVADFSAHLMGGLSDVINAAWDNRQRR